MIISASRRTDIPAFYSQWFMNRIKQGFVLVPNPLFPKTITRVSLEPENVDAIVFWTKNPSPLINELSELDIRGYFYYFLYTLTPYGTEFEQNVPSANSRISTFKDLSGAISAARVIWRYDPIILTENHDVNYHFERFYHLASSLKGYTNECITSFFVGYKKCKKNLKDFDIEHADSIKKTYILNTLKEIAASMEIKLTLCADEEQFEGIEASCCVNSQLISEHVKKTIPYRKDLSQRATCRCSGSIDIGAYNTCRHNCLYCYANFDFEKVQGTVEKYNPNSPVLCGSLQGDELIRVKPPCLKI
jgi:DNA repair photolyase